MPSLLDLLPTTNLGPVNNYEGENQTPSIQPGEGLEDSNLDLTDNGPMVHILFRGEACLDLILKIIPLLVHMDLLKHICPTILMKTTYQGNKWD